MKKLLAFVVCFGLICSMGTAIVGCKTDTPAPKTDKTKTTEDKTKTTT